MLSTTTMTISFPFSIFYFLIVIIIVVAHECEINNLFTILLSSIFLSFNFFLFQKILFCFFYYLITLVCFFLFLQFKTKISHFFCYICYKFWFFKHNFFGKFWKIKTQITNEYVNLNRFPNNKCWNHVFETSLNCVFKIYIYYVYRVCMQANEIHIESCCLIYFVGYSVGYGKFFVYFWFCWVCVVLCCVLCCFVQDGATEFGCECFTVEHFSSTEFKSKTPTL